MRTLVLSQNIYPIPDRPTSSVNNWLLCTAGMLNGIFGDGEARHIAHWQSVKLVDKSEEEEDGKTIIREKERFSNELALVFCSGEIATLK